MNIFAISGLGADHRVFDFLELEGRLEVLPWLDPEKGEPIESYAQRMCSQVDTSQPFVLIGVSFGGLIAVEMSRLIHPEKIILISSVAHHKDLNRFFRFTGRSGFSKLIPARPIPAFVPTNWLFGAKNKQLLKQIIDDTDAKFSQWASRALCTWTGEYPKVSWHRIHGTNDRMMPLGRTLNTSIVHEGGHFMIVDRAQEVSALVNLELGR